MLVALQGLKDRNVLRTDVFVLLSLRVLIEPTKEELISIRYGDLLGFCGSVFPF